MKNSSKLFYFFPSISLGGNHFGGIQAKGKDVLTDTLPLRYV